MQQAQGLLQGHDEHRPRQQRGRIVRLGRADHPQHQQLGLQAMAGQRQWHQLTMTGLFLLSRKMQSGTMEPYSMFGIVERVFKRRFQRAVDRQQPQQHARARGGVARPTDSALAMLARVMHASMQPCMRWERARSCCT